MSTWVGIYFLTLPSEDAPPEFKRYSTTFIRWSKASTFSSSLSTFAMTWPSFVSKSMVIASMVTRVVVLERLQTQEQRKQMNVRCEKVSGSRIGVGYEDV
ncbi:unnamed protein product [Prorocentrum cordatum]|uniref:Uncharacterized protein n=1 Tax=Prorocentrum cordatum TaxID=2364126 RepID=A0ABN9TYA8_9DINO|nr:unnamed protein product [Polarella glacialis]